jgi:ADP-ribosyl-[dinitrogen reductase] hydrolase
MYDVSPDMDITVFNCPPGSWTDDTSMMLCLAVSLLYRKGFNPIDQMEAYVDWWQKGYLSSDDTRGCFDVGRQVSRSLATFVTKYKEWKKGKQDESFDPYFGPTDEYQSGNGAIMRLAPIPIFYCRDPEEARRYAVLSSRTTHGSVDCVDSAAFMCDVITSLFRGVGKQGPFTNQRFESAKVTSIANREYIDKTEDDIETSGYVIHTLEAAMWAFEKTDTFEDGMMLLARMGGDVDTVCCVYGQIAGAYYGFHAIPTRWVDSLKKKDLIFGIAQGLVQSALNGSEDPNRR